jgi:hypothetical protein
MASIVSRHRPQDIDLAWIGSFRTAYAADLAIDHLTEQGCERERLLVAPAELHPADGWQARAQRQPRVRRSIAIGLVPSALLIGMTTLTPLTVASWTFAGLLAAAAIFVAVAVSVERASATRIRQQARADRTVVAERFDVVCSDIPDRARHLLARWWGPRRGTDHRAWLRRRWRPASDGPRPPAASRLTGVRTPMNRRPSRDPVARPQPSGAPQPAGPSADVGLASLHGDKTTRGRYARCGDPVHRSLPTVTELLPAMGLRCAS